MTATVRGISVEDREGAVDRDNNRTYTVVYLVHTDDRDDGPEKAMAAFGIPLLGDVYIPGNDIDQSAVVVDKRAVQRDSPWEWEVEVSYSTQTEDNPQDQQDYSTPLDEPPQISWTSQNRRVVVPGYYNDPDVRISDNDYDLGIVAPNGLLYDPQPEMDVAESVLTITKNVAAIDAEKLMSYANGVNKNMFLGAERRTLRMNGPQAVAAYHNVIGRYWQVTTSCVYRGDKWDLQILNQSEKYIDGSGNLQPFQDKTGVGYIGLLTSTGGAINSSASDESNYGRYTSSGNSPTFTRLRVYHEIDFEATGLF